MAVDRAPGWAWLPARIALREKLHVLACRNAGARSALICLVRTAASPLAQIILPRTGLFATSASAPSAHYFTYDLCNSREIGLVPATDDRYVQTFLYIL